MRIQIARLAVCLALVGGTLAAPARAAELSTVDLVDVRASYRLLTETFYQPLDGHAVVSGARDALVAQLKKNGFAGALLPAVHAPENTTDALTEIAADIDAANLLSKSSDHSLTYVALSGMAKAAGDKYTEFFSPDALKAFNAPLSPEKISGIGVLLEIDPDTKVPRTFYVTPNSPAERAGLQAGDELRAIDGTPTVGFTIEKTSTLLRGKAATNVSLEIERDGKPLPTPLVATRGAVHVPTVLYKLLPSDVGYINILVFGEPTAQEFSTAVARLESKHARGYIIDVRNNGGGYVDAAVSIVSHFINVGPIVSQVERGPHEIQFDADGTAIEPKPLAVLVNGFSASASEITAGALHDSGLATLVGTRTYGKGVVQTVTYLPGSVAIKITTAKYLTPKRHDLNRVGIEPDITVAASKNARFAEPATDAQLEAAVGVIAKKVARIPES